MTTVIQREGESFESLMRRFRKRVNHARILSDVKKNRYYVPKSEQRQIAKRKAIRRERRRQWREAQPSGGPSTPLRAGLRPRAHFRA